MSAAATLPDLPPLPGPTAADRPSRFAPLRSLVRRIIDYGRNLAASLQHPTPTTDLHQVARIFGSYDFGQIIASIIRGLQRAYALEAKLTRLDARPEPEPRPAAALDTPRLRAATSATPRDEQPVTSSIRLVTSEQIDKQVRSRPIGIVLADICRDLGIAPNHPLWRELQAAIIQYDGSLVPLFRAIFLRPWLDPETRQPITSGVPLFCRALASNSTGPPA